MNKKTDYVIDSKSSDEQQQFMAIVPKDGITHSKTEEQKPEPQDIKTSTICPSPGDNNRRNKVSKSQNLPTGLFELLQPNFSPKSVKTWSQMKLGTFIHL